MKVIYNNDNECMKYNNNNEYMKYTTIQYKSIFFRI